MVKSYHSVFLICLEMFGLDSGVCFRVVWAAICPDDGIASCFGR